MRLWKSAAIQPEKAVAYLEACILNGYGEAVPSAGAAERQEVGTGQQVLAEGGPCLRAERDVPAVPLLAHEPTAQTREAAIRPFLGRGRIPAAKPLDDGR